MSKNLILLLETATSVCSVALCEGSKVLAVKEQDERNIHASRITLFIDEVMKAAGRQYRELSAVAVSRGPGSYTGLRIGVSTAKGLCYALDIPLIAVDTLEAMFSGLKTRNSVSAGLYVPMIDARRMEVYMAVYDPDAVLVDPVSASVIDKDFFSRYAGQDLVLFGDGADKLIPVFADNPDVRFETFRNSAADMAMSANRKFADSQFENMAYFEPFYLKDFVATTPRRQV